MEQAACTQENVGIIAEIKGFAGKLVTARKPWGIQKIMGCFSLAQGASRTELLAFVGAAREVVRYSQGSVCYGWLS